MVTINKEKFERLAGNFFDDVRTDYSGRGMYGKTCVGVVTDMQGFLEFTKELAYEVYVAENEDAAELFEQIENVSTDSMGYDTIFYWPNIQVED